MKKKIRNWIGIIVIIYVVCGIALYFLQPVLLFHPEPLPQDHTFSFSQPFEEKKIYYDSSTMFDVVRFRTGNDALRKGAVLYFHGNMNNIEYYAHFAPYFTKNGYEVWMIDYPGYGKSTGERTEAMFYTLSDQLYKLCRAAGFAADSIIIYGKSLGTGIATQLASVKNCKRLILESPYYSIPQIAKHYAFMYPVEWMSEFTIPTHDFITKVVAPVTIFHGTDDGTIPYSNTGKLQPLLKPADEVITIEGGGHNDLYNFPVVPKKIDSLLNGQ
ncbi:alpha/beta fold hydrolase [Panacibacter sp. DH6]|uniref:Alpha/beta fold hydrolase n=1 Tax=Panacibacter microcysteis TaxID=2793269 RepID=A0A931E156_9BACT|nr:alpha/beta fold hydrolase [Panacibacter microcysteis]MBG9376717.1 alpha/beta fold hydrolase [Panacibacter microcysteis]